MDQNTTRATLLPLPPSTKIHHMDPPSSPSSSPWPQLLPHDIQLNKNSPPPSPCEAIVAGARQGEEEGYREGRHGGRFHPRGRVAGLLGGSKEGWCSGTRDRAWSRGELKTEMDLDEMREGIVELELEA